MSSLLEIDDLHIRFPRAYGDVDVVAGVELAMAEGECVGLVGESGSGKSLLGLSILGLLPREARVTGEVRFRGIDLVSMPESRRRALRGAEIAMIYQDALSSLNPVLTVGRVLGAACKRGGRHRPTDLLDLVALRDHDRILRAYPHELSGGQRQRALIALALAQDPRLVVADEPTTALDVTIQAQIAALLRRLCDEMGFSLLLISHDLGLVAGLANRIAVMYAGQIAESRPARTLLRAPLHPYSRGLLDSRRSLEQRDETLRGIPGTVPTPTHFASGCRFRDRCPRAQDRCATTPAFERADSGRLACWNPVPEAAR
jgi:oligopeptide/dipeptide ABC transporter ATP-binding protein